MLQTSHRNRTALYLARRTAYLTLMGLFTLLLCILFPRAAWAAEGVWEQEALDGTVVASQTVTAFASDGTVIYAGVDGGGVYVRNSSGTWFSANNGLTNLSVRALAYDGARLYAGTSLGVSEYDTATDSWKAANSGAPFIFDVFSLLSVGSTLYAGTDAWGVWSYDGTSWTHLESTGLRGSVVWDLAYHNNALHAATSDGVFEYIDEGTGWKETGWTATDSNASKPLTVRSLISVDSTLYAGTDGDFNDVYAYDGTSWTPMYLGVYGKRVYAFAYDGATLYAGTTIGDVHTSGIAEGVFFFDDAASTWIAMNSGLTGTNLNIHALFFQNNTLFAGTKTDGVFSLHFAPIDPPAPKPAPDSNTGAPADAGLARTSDVQAGFLAAALVAALIALTVSVTARRLQRNKTRL